MPGLHISGGHFQVWCQKGSQYLCTIRLAVVFMNGICAVLPVISICLLMLLKALNFDTLAKVVIKAVPEALKKVVPTVFTIL